VRLSVFALILGLGAAVWFAMSAGFRRFRLRGQDHPVQDTKKDQVQQPQSHITDPAGTEPSSVVKPQISPYDRVYGTHRC